VSDPAEQAKQIQQKLQSNVLKPWIRRQHIPITCCYLPTK